MYLKIILIVLVSVFFVGCNNLKQLGHANEYKSVQPTDNEKKIVIPEGLNSSKLESYYKIPEVKDHYKPSPVSLIPPGSSLKNN